MMLEVGKLPVELLRSILEAAPINDDRVLLGPQIGADCAVVDLGERLLVIKSDPITFAADEIGWYLVQVNCNDIATTGAEPRWMMLTMLLPEGKTSEDLVTRISSQVYKACRELGISVIGGHSEVTYDLNRPLLIGTLIGEVDRERLVTPAGMRPGNALLLTKGIPIEGSAILAREHPNRLSQVLSEEELLTAQNFLFDPGISVLRDAQVAMKAGSVTAMHDPTEGGLAAALWELAEGADCSIEFDPAAVFVPPISAKICSTFELDPLATIASGALLIAAETADAPAIQTALTAEGIDCRLIGRVKTGPPAVWQTQKGKRSLLARPQLDDIGKVMASQQE